MRPKPEWEQQRRKDAKEDGVESPFAILLCVFAPLLFKILLVWRGAYGYVSRSDRAAERPELSDARAKASDLKQEHSRAFDAAIVLGHMITLLNMHRLGRR